MARFGVVGVDGQPAPVDVGGFVDAPHHIISRADETVRAPLVRAKRERALVLGHRFVGFAASEQRGGKVVMRLDVLGVELDGLPVDGNSVVDAPCKFEQSSQVTERVGVLSIELQRAFVRANRLLQAPLPSQDVAQIVERGSVVGANFGRAGDRAGRPCLCRPARTTRHRENGGRRDDRGPVRGCAGRSRRPRQSALRVANQWRIAAPGPVRAPRDPGPLPWASRPPLNQRRVRVRCRHRERRTCRRCSRW